MQQIIQEGNNIGNWETKEITNLNPVYIEAEKYLEKGYKMYYTNQFVEAFVLFMRFTKFFDIVCEHSHLIINSQRHIQLNKSFIKIIPILEKIKPQLIEKYEKKVLPNVPTRKISFSEEDTKKEDTKKKEIDSNSMIELEERWKTFTKIPILPIIPIIPILPIIPNNVNPSVSQPINNKLIQIVNAKTTDDIDNSKQTLTKLVYTKNDGTPLDALAILELHLKEHNLKIKDVPGDNNCQFHAIIDQLFKIGINGWTDIKLRKKAVKWLKENGERAMDDGKIGEQTLLKDAIGVPNWNRYIKEMSEHGKTWGDEATLLAISVLFKIEIIIISSLPNNYNHIIKPPDIWNIELKNKIYLGHYHEFHYVSTQTKL